MGALYLYPLVHSHPRLRRGSTLNAPPALDSINCTHTRFHEISFPRSGNQRRCWGKTAETNFGMNGEVTAMPYAVTHLS